MPVLVDNTITFFVHVATVVVSIRVSASIISFEVTIEPRIEVSFGFRASTVPEAVVPLIVGTVVVVPVAFPELSIFIVARISVAICFSNAIEPFFKIVLGG